MDLDKIREINQKLEEKNFVDQEINIQAGKDFKFLCNKLGFNTFVDVNYQKVNDSMGRPIAEFFIMGQNLSGDKVVLPGQYINTENSNLYVAVVGYIDSKPVDIYVFKTSDFAKAGLFSMYKYNKKTNDYMIKLPNEEKLKLYSFGYVFKK